MNTEKRSDRSSERKTDARAGHPVGTGVGAAGGAAAGAAIGSAAGPVGAGVGLVTGAVAGAAVGHGAADAMESTNGQNLQRYIDYTVVDRDEEKIGTLDSVWADTEGRPAYLAVRTGWLGLGHSHIVPANRAEVSESRRKIRLPYSVAQVKDAPSFASADEIDRGAEDRISKYYRQYGFKPDDETRSTRMSRSSALGGAGAETGNAASAPRSQRQNAEDTTMRLKEEQLKVGKREVEYGGVRLRKIIRTETVNQPVELKREEIVIERIPASGEAAACGDAQFNEREVYIPLRREEPVIAKEMRVREEVRVGKKSESEQRNVSESIRREDIEIEEQGEARKTPKTKR